MKTAPSQLRRKLFMLDPRVLNGLESLARERGKSVNQLADEALRQFLKTNAQPLTLREALTQSARTTADNDAGNRPKRLKS
ncbi:MAG: hypothetical protein AB7S74_02350 [Hyphomicrobium sp.]